MGHKDDGLAIVSQGSHDGVGEESFANVGVDGRERIIKQNNVCIEIEGPSNIDLCITTCESLDMASDIWELTRCF